MNSGVSSSLGVFTGTIGGLSSKGVQTSPLPWGFEMNVINCESKQGKDIYAYGTRLFQWHNYSRIPGPPACTTLRRFRYFMVVRSRNLQTFPLSNLISRQIKSRTKDLSTLQT